MVSLNIAYGFYVSFSLVTYPGLIENANEVVYLAARNTQGYRFHVT